MRTSILFGRERGENKLLVLLEGPGNPKKVNAAYKKAVAERRLAEVQLWSSHGGCQKRKLISGATGTPNTTPAIGGETRQAAESASAAPEAPAPGEQPSEAGQPGGDDEPSLGGPDDGKKSKRK